MTEIRKAPCATCPYRKDVPSGIWAHSEYEKLRLYDGETWEQPLVPFMCHTTPEKFCNGWALCHDAYELLALRLSSWDGEVPKSVTPLFASGKEAADHGQAEIEEPSEQANRKIQSLIRRRKKRAMVWPKQSSTTT